MVNKSDKEYTVSKVWKIERPTEYALSKSSDHEGILKRHESH